MAIFDFLFGSSNPPPVETSNITTSEIPQYIAGPTADIIGEAMDVGFVARKLTRQQLRQELQHWVEYLLT